MDLAAVILYSHCRANKFVVNMETSYLLHTMNIFHSDK